MDKIICDICGTLYPVSSECCPICGCSSDAAAELLNTELQSEDFVEETSANAPLAAGSGKKKEIFDFDEVNSDNTAAKEDEEETYVEDEEEDEDEDDAPRHNTFAVILLTVLIVALLGAAAFIFVRFFLPNMGKDEPVSTTAAVQEMETTGATTEPTVPCLQMGMLNAAVAELNAEGQQFLLHIKAFPENTTDKIVYTSADESIATVTEDGKITAVSEGETKIYISCGKVSMDCPVIVKYVEETVSPITEETVPEETELSATEPEAAEPNETNPDESASTEEVEEEPADNQANAALKNVTLKLKKKDIQLGVYYQFQLVLDCDLDPEEVTWSSEHPHIATVDEQGNVTAVKEGTTSISAKYGDQEVQCIVRCIWY